VIYYSLLRYVRDNYYLSYLLQQLRTVEMNDLNIPIEEFTLAMEEHNNHIVLTECCDLIYKHGLLRVLTSLSDYCCDPKEAYALAVLANIYKENELAFCKDAPTMQ